MDTLAPKALSGDWKPGFMVKHFIKDIGLALQEAEEREIALPGADTAPSPSTTCSTPSAAARSVRRPSPCCIRKRPRRVAAGLDWSLYTAQHEHEEGLRFAVTTTTTATMSAAMARAITTTATIAAATMESSEDGYGDFHQRTRSNGRLSSRSSARSSAIRRLSMRSWRTWSCSSRRRPSVFRARDSAFWRSARSRVARAAASPTSSTRSIVLKRRPAGDFSTRSPSLWTIMPKRLGAAYEGAEAALFDEALRHAASLGVPHALRLGSYRGAAVPRRFGPSSMRRIQCYHGDLEYRARLLGCLHAFAQGRLPAMSPRSWPGVCSSMPRVVREPISRRGRARSTTCW